MKVTEEMIRRGMGESNAERYVVEVVLEAALADLPEPVPGPFVLFEHETSAKRFVEGTPGHGPLSATGKVLAEALDRAVRTLGAQAGGEWTEDDYLRAEAALDHERHRGVKTEKSCHAAKVALDAVKHRLAAPAVELLSEDTYKHVAAIKAVAHLKGTAFGDAVDWLTRIFPKPAPVVKTNEELVLMLRERDPQDGDYDRILDELLRRANGKMSSADEQRANVASFHALPERLPGKTLAEWRAFTRGWQARMALWVTAGDLNALLDRLDELERDR